MVTLNVLASNINSTVRVVAGTTGLRGEDSEVRGRLYINFKGYGGDFNVSSEANGFTLKAVGDLEITSIIRSLEFILFALKNKDITNKTVEVPCPKKNLLYVY